MFTTGLYVRTLPLVGRRYTAKDVSPIDQAQELTNYFYLGTNQCDYADVAADHALALPVWQPQTYTGGGALRRGLLPRTPPRTHSPKTAGNPGPPRGWCVGGHQPHTVPDCPAPLLLC